MQPFDQPVIALREKILELHDMAETQGLDFKEELHVIQNVQRHSITLNRFVKISSNCTAIVMGMMMQQSSVESER